MQVRRLTLIGLAAAMAAGSTTIQAGAGAKAACNSSNPLKIGAMFTMSGPGAGLGKNYQRGASMAFRDINAAGGVLGRCVKEVLKDEGGSPTKGAQVVRELIDQEKVQFIIGPFFSSVTGATIPYMNAAKVININQSSFAAAGDAKLYPYTFRTEADTTQQAAALIPYLKANKWTRVAVIAVNDAFGTIFTKTIQEMMPPAGITITKSVLLPTGTADATPQMSELKNSNPQMLLAGLSADPDQVAMLKARSQLLWGVPVVGTNAMANAGTVNNFTKAQLKGVYTGPGYKTIVYTSAKVGAGRPTSPTARKFISAFTKWIKAHNLKFWITQPAGSYDAVMLLANAANKSKSLNPDTIKNYLESHPYAGVRGKLIWGKNRHDGTNQAMFAFAIASSLNNFGALQLAPNQ